MAIVENRLTEDGDVLYIKTDTPIVGIIVLSDFVDVVYGQTPSVYFTKEFRYSLDGITYSQWLELTNVNLSTVSVEARDTLSLEYKYARVGDGNYPITFKSVNVGGNYSPVDNSTTYKKSIFAKYFDQNDAEVLAWAINVLEKLYSKGIIPEFLDRNKTDDSRNDKDYIDFWRTCTTFFAYIVTYARNFLDLSNTITLSEYLRQNNCFTSNNGDLDELKYIRDNLYREMTLRGSNGMLSKVKTETRPVYGEVLRLIDYNGTDEFVFTLLEPRCTGWNVDLTSPTWGGLNDQPTLNKSWEDTSNVVDVSKYPLKGTVSLIDGRLSVDAADSGVWYDNSDATPANVAKLIPVSPNLSYLISFNVRATTTDDLSLSFGVDCYNSAKVQISSYNAYDGSSRSNFFDGEALNSALYGQDICIQGVIFNKDKVEFADIEFDTVPAIGVGRHLRFDEDVAYICPKIIFNSPPPLAGNHKMFNIKITPYNSNYYEGATVDSCETVKMFANNRNPQYSTDELVFILKRYFINYNCGLNYTEISAKVWDWDIIFRPFDYLVVRYNYGVGDLDTQTKIINTGEPTIDGKWVGYGGNGASNGTYVLDSSTHNYLHWGGDNRQGGVESTLMSFQNMAANYPSTSKFKVSLGATWWDHVGGTSYDVVVEMTTYVGGAMNKSGYNFINVGGEQVDSYSVTKTVTSANQNYNFQILAEIEYNAITKKATFTGL